MHSASGILHVAAQESAVDGLAEAARRFEPALEVIPLPAWDCLPYDRALPSRTITGRRVQGLARIASKPGVPRLVVVSAAGLVQRVPPRARLAERRVRLRDGDELDRDWLERTLVAFGYLSQEQVDEPGEFVVREQAADIFAPGAPMPVRLHLKEGRIASIQSFDPVSQRDGCGLTELLLLPATEGFAVPGEGVSGIAERLLPEGPLETLFDILPSAPVVVGEGAAKRIAEWLDTVADAHAARRIALANPALEPPERRYLTQGEIEAALRERPVIAFETGASEGAGLERIAGDPARTLRSLGALIDERAKTGDAVLVCAPEPARLLRRLKRKDLGEISAWRDALRLQPGEAGILASEIAEGFRIGILSVLAGNAALPRRATANLAGLEPLPLRLGDLAVHLEHGVARAARLEYLEQDQGITTECLVLEFAGENRLLVPAADLGSVWRYAGPDAAARLDRPTGEGWFRRRDEIAAELREVARGLSARRARREATPSPPLKPDNARMDRFRARVPYALTADQQNAIDAALADMARPHPMDRLVCGDVGFGKTEVALHAAAAAVFAGFQVAVAAPTTLLARQHLEVFSRRLGAAGIEVLPLLRSSASAEARATLKRMRETAPLVVVGTQALASRTARFAKLGLTIIDEEQRFGERQKDALRRLREGAHTLTMSATPLPRSLQAAMAGLVDVSLLATPPVARQPVRTAVLPFDGGTVRAALMREARRGGQSFFVCPRIDDLAPMAKRLAELVPELNISQAHGRMRGEALDRVMLDFADGRIDVLLATGIIEAGLDIPNANTILVWRPDRFGLAELHQLRGRVGRGRARASAFLLTDPEHRLARNAIARLERLAALDRLGAGFAISAADLDQRGAGDLLGERQAGHVRAVGSGLYAHLLGRALAAEQGQELPSDLAPRIRSDAAAFIPENLVASPDLRLELYSRLARLTAFEAIDEFEAELQDRFGDLPPAVTGLLDTARLRCACQRAGIAEVQAGPAAIALTPVDPATSLSLASRLRVPAHTHGSRIIAQIAEPDPNLRLTHVVEMLAEVRERVSGRAAPARE